MLAFRIAGWSGCESQPSLLVRQIVLITLIDEFSMCLYFVVMNGFVIQRSRYRICPLRFLRDIVILCITVTKDVMLEIAQILEHKHESFESGYH